jgi:hypothetical protein
VELHVDAQGFDEPQVGGDTVNIEVEIFASADRATVKTFAFRADLDGIENVVLGPRLMSTYVSLPCDVTLIGAPELEFTAPVQIHGRRLQLQGTALVVRAMPATKGDGGVLLSGEALESAITEIVTNGVDLVVALSDRKGVAFPVVRYVEERQAEIADPDLKEKFLRLKRILVHFRSHSKGALAKYRHKIEHARVLGTQSGPAILQKLLDDGILTRDGSFYFLEPAQVDHHLGVSWDSLTKGRTSDKLLAYLRAVD